MLDFFGTSLVVFAQEQFAPHGPNWVADALVPIVAIISVFTMIVFVVAVPVTVAHRYKRCVAELNAAVKQQMIERGYSVDEILAVIHEDPKLVRSSRSSVGKMTPSKVPLQQPTPV